MILVMCTCYSMFSGISSIVNNLLNGSKVQNPTMLQLSVFFSKSDTLITKIHLVNILLVRC